MPSAQQINGPRRTGVVATWAAALGGALTFMLLAPPAGALFDGPVDIAGPTLNAAPHVKVNAVGDALIIWNESDGGAQSHAMYARARAADGTLGAQETIFLEVDTGISPTESQMAMDAAGNALIVWRRDCCRLESRFRQAGGGLHPTVVLTRDERAVRPQVAMNAQGDALIVWETDDVNTGAFRIKGLFRSAAGELGPVQTLSGPSVSAPLPQIAVDDSGDALVVWTHYEGIFSRRIYARVRQADGTLSPIEKLSRPGRDVEEPHLATNARGDALVVWFDWTTGRNRGRFRAHEALFGPEHALSRGNHYRSALDGKGNALHIWIDFEDGRVYGRTRSADGQLGPVERLSPASDSTFSPLIAMNARGQAVVSWRNVTKELNQARYRTPAGDFKRVQDIPGSGADSANHELVVAANGKALIAWKTDSPGFIRVSPGP